MNSIYIKNLRCLKKLSYSIYNKVIKTENDSAYIKKISKGRKNIYKNIGENRMIYVHSNYDSMLQGKVIAENVLKEDKDIILLFGMGLGYELKEIIKKAPKKTYIIIEPDLDIFKTMLENIDFISIFNGSNKVELIVENNTEEIKNHFDAIISKYKTTSIAFVVLPFYQNLYKDLLKKSFNLINQSLRAIQVTLATNINTDRQWMFNYARNFKYLKETYPLELLGDKLKDMPAIIVGAGPSLESNLEHLKKIRGQAIIVAAGSGLTVMERNGIKADVVGAMDGNKDSEGVFNNLQLNKNSVLFYSTQVFSTIPEMFEGKKFLMNQTPMDVYINRHNNGKNNNYFSGPSITNVLAYNLSVLGCNPIIFLGQDLCGKNNISYCKDTVYNESNIASPVLSIKVNNKKGEECYSDSAFLSMKDNMELIIKSFPNTNYLNGTESGLHITGTDDIDFNKYTDEVLLKKPVLDYKQKIEEVLYDSLKVKKNISSTFIDDLNNDINKISNILSEILKFIGMDKSDFEKEGFIEKNEKELLKIDLYIQVIDKLFRTNLELSFANKDKIERKKNIYMYYLDKCNIMLYVLNKQLKSIKDDGGINE